MAVDLLGFQKMDDHLTIPEAVSAKLKSIEEQLLYIFQSHQQQQNLYDSKGIFAGFTVPEHKQADSVARRTGHARFRRGPSDLPTSTSTSKSEPAIPLQEKPKLETAGAKIFSEDRKNTTSPASSGNSSITGDDGSVSNGKPELVPAVVTPVRVFSSGKPPLPSSHRKRSCELDSSKGVPGQHSLSHGCHCCKRRKLVVKRVETKGLSKVADIPADQYSWKKYDQKLVPGSSFPRGYYRCISAKGCPARKRVGRSESDPTVLIVTYKGDHRHSGPHPSLPRRF